MVTFINDLESFEIIDAHYNLYSHPAKTMIEVTLVTLTLW